MAPRGRRPLAPCTTPATAVTSRRLPVFRWAAPCTAALSLPRRRSVPSTPLSGSDDSSSGMVPPAQAACSSRVRAWALTRVSRLRPDPLSMLGTSASPKRRRHHWPSTSREPTGAQPFLLQAQRQEQLLRHHVVAVFV